MKMDYKKHGKRVMALLRKCCNYDMGQCVRLDGVCPMPGYVYNIPCKHFRNAVLPLDGVLFQELMEYNGQTETEYVKTCKCGSRFSTSAKNQRYCPKCALKQRREKTKTRVSELRKKNTRSCNAY